MAHYLWPPRWVGDRVPEPGEFGEIVVRVDLPDGIRAHAARDGLITFALGPDAPRYHEENTKWVQTLLRLINAHLACLHSIGGPSGSFKADIATPFTTLQVHLEDDDLVGMSDGTGGTIMALHRARHTAQEDFVDWRFRRSQPGLGEARMRESFALMKQLLERPSRDVVLLRAEMLARAKSALLAMDAIGALTYAWATFEGLLSDLLSAYLLEHEDRPTQDAEGRSAKFINSERRRFFDGSQMTVRHVAEVLSLLDRLPFPLYKAAIDCAHARNKWLHAEEPPTLETSTVALKACGDLFELVDGVALHVLPSP